MECPGKRFRILWNHNLEQCISYCKSGVRRLQERTLVDWHRTLTSYSADCVIGVALRIRKQVFCEYTTYEIPYNKMYKRISMQFVFFYVYFLSMTASEQGWKVWTSCGLVYGNVNGTMRYLYCFPSSPSPSAFSHLLPPKWLEKKNEMHCGLFTLLF